MRESDLSTSIHAFRYDAELASVLRSIPATPASIAAPISAISSSLEYDSEPKVFSFSMPSRPMRDGWPVLCVSSWNSVEQNSSAEPNAWRDAGRT